MTVSFVQKAPSALLKQFPFLISLQTPRSPVHEGLGTMLRFLLRYSPRCKEPDRSWLFARAQDPDGFIKDKREWHLAVAFTHAKHSPEEKSLTLLP